LKDPAIVAPDAAALLSRFDHAGLERSVSTVVYLAGRRREAVLENGFAERNINVTTIETYDAPLVENPFATLHNETIDAVFLMSRRAARAFGKAWSAKHAPRAICISEHVADALPADYGGEKITARVKTLDAMVRALD
jgi:uroporphyrinogen-III synthase